MYRDLLKLLNRSLDYCRELLQVNSDIFSWIEEKEDGQHILTNMDVAIEEILKSSIREAYPTSGIIAEESIYDRNHLKKELCFIIDPIDGTKEFISGGPGYGIEVAVLSHGQPLLALLDFPARGQRFQAICGQGATLNGQRVRVSMMPDIYRAHIVVSPSQMNHACFEKVQIILGEATLTPVRAISPRLAMLIQGEADAAFHLGLKATQVALWDFAAAALILQEAGGCFTDLNGQPLMATLPLVQYDGWVATNSHTHRELLELLQTSRNCK